MIDIDALSEAGTAPPSSGKGKGAAKVARFEKPIDVDDPVKWTTPASSSAGGPSSAGDKVPMLKFGGSLGVALYDQKMEVLAEEAENKDQGMALPDDGALANTVVPVTEAEPGVGVAPAEVVPRGGTAAAATVVARGGEAMRTVAVSDCAAASSNGAVASTAAMARGGEAPPSAAASHFFNTVARNGGFVRRPSSRSKAVLVQLSRRHRPGNFVRRAPRMTVVPIPRMVVDPPTPPQSDSESDVAIDLCEDDSEEEMAGAASASAHNVGGATDDDASPRVDGTKDSGDKEARVNMNGAPVAENSSAEDAARPAAGAPPVHPAASEPHVAGQPSVGGLPPPTVGTANDANALAEQLAARSRNPRIFPAAFWQPHVPAVLVAAQAPRAGLPPIAPFVARRAVPVGAAVLSAPQPTVPPPSSLPASQPPMADPTDDSSEEMDDDALVAAYITPPASPLPPSTAASPGHTRPSAGSRRRANDSRAGRAAAGAASSSAGAETDLLPSSLRDVQAAVRNGFSSLRREITRLRVEVVVVKSQSASTLRRMDGIAAAADERQSGNGEVLQRLAVLDRAVQGLGARMSTVGGVTADDNAAPGDSVALVAEIKVRLLSRRAHPLIMRGAVRVDSHGLVPMFALLVLSASSNFCCYSATFVLWFFGCVLTCRRCFTTR